MEKLRRIKSHAAAVNAATTLYSMTLGIGANWGVHIGRVRMLCELIQDSGTLEEAERLSDKLIKTVEEYIKN